MPWLDKPRALLYALYVHDDRWIQMFDYNLFFNARSGEDALVLVGVLGDMTGDSSKELSFPEWQKRIGIRKQ